MALRKRTNAYWAKRSTERVALLERQSEPYIRKVNGIYADAREVTKLDELPRYSARGILVCSTI